MNTPQTMKELTDIITVAKALILGGGSIGVFIAAIIWAIKKLWAFLFTHHDNVTKHIDGRETSLDKKEEMIFSAATKQGEQVFTLLANMTEKNSLQTAAITESSKAIQEMSGIMKQHGELMQQHNTFFEKLLHQIELRNEELVARVNNNFENAFANYIHLLQANPEVARRILAERNNPLAAVADTVRHTVVLPDPTEPNHTPA